MNRLLLLAIATLSLVGCSSSPAENSTAQDEAALKSGKGATPPAGFKAPGSDGQAPAGAGPASGGTTA